MKKLQSVIYILVTIILFSIFFMVKSVNQINKLQRDIEITNKENERLLYENNYLLNENERLGMINTDIWELFIAEVKIEKGDNNE